LAISVIPIKLDNHLAPIQLLLSNHSDKSIMRDSVDLKSGENKWLCMG